MNKKFIKKNIFMIVFMFMSLIAVIALVIMVLSEHKSMKKYDTKKGELLGKIKKIGRQKPSPVKINVARIKKDIISYNKETKKIRSKFGHPYALALKSFVEVLGVDLGEFKAKFGEYWDAEKMRATRDLIYLRYKVRQFSKDFPDHKSEWNRAMQAFMREAQKVTLEEIDVSNVDGIFLAAMGKGRRFSDDPGRCLTFMKRMRNKMIDYFDGKKVTCETTDFSFKHDQEPLVGDIERIARAWEIVADLGKRIADAKANQEKDVLRLVSFSKRGLDGEKDGDYTMYRFSFTVRGDLNTIRRLVKNLYVAYAVNRIYAIRDIKLSRTVDSVNDILDESERVKEDLDYDTRDKEGIEGKEGKESKYGKQSPVVKPGNLGKNRFDLSSIKGKKDDNLTAVKSLKKKPVVKEKRKILGPKDRGYAQVVVGKNNICSVEFDVDYIVFDNSQNN